MKISILAADLSSNCLVRPYLLAKILQRRYEVEIVGPTFGEGVWKAVAGDGSLSYRAVDFRGRLRPWGGLTRLPALADGDVLYACKPLLTSFGVALWKRRAGGRPLVLDIEDWELGFIRGRYRNAMPSARLRYLSSSTLFPYRMGSYWNIALHERLVRRADVVTVSNHFLQQRFGGELIWHARDTAAFDPARFEKGAARERLGIGKDRKVAVFSGTPRIHKGLEVAIRATGALRKRDVLLLIVGMGADGYCRSLISLGERELGERFRHLGLRPFEDVPGILAAADMVVIPQRRSPATVGQLPAKVFDAMAMALPVVATDVSDLREILDGCGWVVEPDRPEELAEAMRTVLDNPAEAAERGRRARQRCIERYSWDAMEKVLCDIFQKYE